MIVQILRHQQRASIDQYEHSYIYYNLLIHPGSGSDRTIASEQQLTALTTLYIGRLVTWSQKKIQCT